MNIKNIKYRFYLNAFPKTSQTWCAYNVDRNSRYIFLMCINYNQHTIGTQCAYWCWKRENKHLFQCYHFALNYVDKGQQKNIQYTKRFLWSKYTYIQAIDENTTKKVLNEIRMTKGGIWRCANYYVLCVDFR